MKPGPQLSVQQMTEIRVLYQIGVNAKRLAVLYRTYLTTVYFLGRI